MTSVECRMTSNERDADMATVAAAHRSRQNKYKDVRNSWFQRSSCTLGLLLNPLNLLIIVIPLQNPGALGKLLAMKGDPVNNTKKRAKRESRIDNMLQIKHLPFREARKTGANGGVQVPVASKRVGVASECVPVASRQAQMGCELSFQPVIPLQFPEKSPRGDATNLIWKFVEIVQKYIILKQVKRESRAVRKGTYGS